MKTIRVVAAVIKAVKEDGRTMIFATQRGYGEFKGGWEFPGGKIEAGETPQEALKREIMIGVFTKDIQFEEQDEKITVHVNYALDINGDPVADCNIDIKITALER